VGLSQKDVSLQVKQCKFCTSSRMAFVLATFILAAQEIVDLLYFALLFMNDQRELNSLVAKNACCAPQGISHSSLC